MRIMDAGSILFDCAKRIFGMEVDPPEPISIKEVTRAKVLLVIFPSPLLYTNRSK